MTLLLLGVVYNSEAQHSKNCLYIEGRIPAALIFAEVVPKFSSPAIGFSHSIRKNPEKRVYLFVGMEFSYDYYYESTRRAYDPEMQIGIYNFKVHDALLSPVVGVNFQFGVRDMWYVSPRAAIGFGVYNTKTFDAIYGKTPPNYPTDSGFDGLVNIPYEEKGVFRQMPAAASISLAIGRKFNLGNQLSTWDLGYRVGSSYAATDVGSEGFTMRFSYYL